MKDFLSLPYIYFYDKKETGEDCAHAPSSFSAQPPLHPFRRKRKRSGWQIGSSKQEAKCKNLEGDNNPQQLPELTGQFAQLFRRPKVAQTQEIPHVASRCLI